MSSLVTHQTLNEFVVAALESSGVPAAYALITADALVKTDLRGVHTHGTKLLAGYLRKLINGGYPPDARPTIEKEGPGWAIVDGAAGLGQVGCHFAIQTAIEKATSTGIAYVGLKNTGHIGAAGHFAAVAAEAGFIAMITGNDIPSVAAPGSRRAVLGSNPLAYAIPKAGAPILLDIATAAVAGGKVYAAHQRGEPIPSTWLIGSDGHPTTDGTLYPHQASLAPMAGHKGYGLGLWCEILSAIIPGGAMTWQVGSWIFDPPSKPSMHNASCVVMNVDMIVGREEFQARLQSLIDEVQAAPTADGVDSILLPGEREDKNLQHAMRHGIALPTDVIAKLREAAELCNIPAPGFLA